MPNYYTQKGLEQKRQQIKKQETKVAKIGKEVGEEAGVSCDWHDNFGYEDAMRRLSLESKILHDLRIEISNSQVIEIKEQDDFVAIGTTVDLLINGENKTYTVGAFGESNPENQLISYTSPLAMKILGLEVDDEFVIILNGKKSNSIVVKIYPPSYRYNQIIEEFNI
jgi:transcription elongation GreA/GreB family factor